MFLLPSASLALLGAVAALLAQQLVEQIVHLLNPSMLSCWIAQHQRCFISLASSKIAWVRYGDIYNTSPSMAPALSRPTCCSISR